MFLNLGGVQEDEGEGDASVEPEWRPAYHNVWYTPKKYTGMSRGGDMGHDHLHMDVLGLRDCPQQESD